MRPLAPTEIVAPPATLTSVHGSSVSVAQTLMSNGMMCGLSAAVQVSSCEIEPWRVPAPVGSTQSLEPASPPEPPPPSLPLTDWPQPASEANAPLAKTRRVHRTRFDIATRPFLPFGSAFSTKRGDRRREPRCYGQG